ncbi:ABC transporter permease [Taklimakanibacter deserti]|uniref:ABC transporter permease n=1 Tax=Taklimakanibacter deserti TaxID=2267839 RepID=UPI0034D5E70B
MTAPWPAMADQAVSEIPLPADLEAAARKVERRQGLEASLLILPLVILIAFAFLIPVGLLLFKSIDNPVIAEGLPRTLSELEAWTPADGAPPEAAYAALKADIETAREKASLGTIGARLNQDFPGARSLLQTTARKLEAASGATAKETFAVIDRRWGEPRIFGAIRNAGSPYTANYYLNALDLTRGVDGGIIAKPEGQRLHIHLFIRTLWVSALTAFICFLLAYPIAYLLAHLPERRANLLMIIVLLPFWTSILVRITSWIALLQKQGVVNDTLAALGVIDEAGRLALMYNMTGTIVVGTHILLPFFVLPLYSVMKTVNPNLVRAATSLGASPFTAFRRVYFPLTVPGIFAGSSLVFILCTGYFITPALVGGQNGQLISNIIAYHMQQSLNWGLAAALSTLLLLLIGIVYVIYTRFVRDGR